jgi:tRNA threonylcarbamoyl adenosine modification protein YeaZ
MNDNLDAATSVKTYGLALHTASAELGLAISNFAGDSRSQTWNLGRDLATDLHQRLVEFIGPQTWADLAFIAVAKGPGGFTGTRMGVVTARTLAQQLEIPVFAISTLAAVAFYNHRKSPSNLNIALQMRAQRGQLFGAVYSVNNSGVIELLPDTVMSPEAWQEKLESCGDACQLIEVASELGRSVSSVLELAYLEWEKGSRPGWWEALPYYGQHPVEGK